MSRKSATDHTRKICRCAKWKECTHPWYVDYREGSDRDPGGRRVLRRRLSLVVGREPVDFADAKEEAQRAITAWKNNLDARELLPSDRPTLAALIDAYGQRPNASPVDRWQVGALVKAIVLGRPFGAWRACEITREVIEAYRQPRPLVAGNRDLKLLRAVFNWGVLAGFVTATPFKVGTVAVVKLGREEPRTRRLHPGEDAQLLQHAGRLRDLIIAALETGCRRGELLSLQWHQVRFTPRAEIFLPAGKTKAKKDRRLPISTVLRAVLEARQYDPAGELLPASAYVFGDEIGRRRVTIKTAWNATCRRAHITDLHFHDLRREAGSRWMDAGIPLATIQRWLGHYNISQTSTYLGASLGGDEQDMRRFEERIGRVPAGAEHGGLTDPLTDAQVRPAPTAPSPLTQIDPFSGSTGRNPAASNHGAIENTQQNRIMQNPSKAIN